MSELIERDIRNHIAAISMRREAKRNAADRHLADAINGALNRLGTTPTSVSASSPALPSPSAPVPIWAAAKTTRPSAAGSTPSSVGADASR
jgi:hypothetical protein